VIENVWPYLLPFDFMRPKSTSYAPLSAMRRTVTAALKKKMMMMLMMTLMRIMKIIMMMVGRINSTDDR
jgi:hypothetical protein